MILWGHDDELFKELRAEAHARGMEALRSVEEFDEVQIYCGGKPTGGYVWPDGDGEWCCAKTPPTVAEPLSAQLDFIRELAGPAAKSPRKVKAKAKPATKKVKQKPKAKK